MKTLIPILFVLMILFNSCGQEVSTTPEDVLITNNALFVDSDPQGSLIFIDGRSTGQRTPDTITWLGNGKHLVTLKSSFLKDTSEVVTVTDGIIDSVFFDYRSNPTMYGKLNIDSEPRGAEIYLNDTNSGFFTPKQFDNIFAGEYKVTYKLSGYWDLNSNVKVTSGRTITVDRRLSDSLTWVNYTKAVTGLPSDYYNSVDIQNGYIKWIGSVASGLVRYDGSEFIVYNTENSAIPGNNITVVEAVNNGVWVGTIEGAAFFDGQNFQVYNTANSPLATNVIKCIFSAPDGKIWIGTYDKGVYVFDGINWISYTSENSPVPTNFIRSIYVEANGTAWIGTYGGGLVKYDGTNWTIFNNGLPPSLNVEAILIAANSDIWVGCAYLGLNPGGAAVRRNNSWSTYETAGFNILSIAEDEENVLWFASYETGLLNFNGSTWKAFAPTNSSLLSNRVNCVAVDGAGDIWLTTVDRGFYKYKGN